MSYTSTSTRLGPEFTPDLIKRIIFATVGISVGASLLNGLFRWIFGTTGPQEWLSLTVWGLQSLFLWQPVSYLFVQSTGLMGITTGFLITLAFQMYLLWVLGSNVMEWIGPKPFLALYFGCGALTGLTTLGLMFLLGKYAVIAGPTAAIIALCVVWAMMNPNSEVLLFFLIPVKTRWLVVGALGALILINLSQWNLINLIFYSSATFYGYLFATAGWGLHSPFAYTQKFDRWANRMGSKLKKRGKDSKIIDFTKEARSQKQEQNDDEFVDEMLSKIAKNGEQSLSWRERRKLNKISERKAQKTNNKSK